MSSALRWYGSFPDHIWKIEFIGLGRKHGTVFIPTLSLSAFYQLLSFAPSSYLFTFPMPTKVTASLWPRDLVWYWGNSPMTCEVAFKHVCNGLLCKPSYTGVQSRLVLCDSKFVLLDWTRKPMNLVHMWCFCFVKYLANKLSTFIHLVVWVCGCNLTASASRYETGRWNIEMMVNASLVQNWAVVFFF